MRVLLKLHLELLFIFLLSIAVIEIRLTVLHASILCRLLVLSAHVLKDWFISNVLSVCWLVVKFCFLDFLLFNHLNILISADLRRILADHKPRRIRYLLHLQQSIRLKLVLRFGILILFVEKLLIVLCGVHKADVFFELLLERLRELHACLSFDLLNS